MLAGAAGEVERQLVAGARSRAGAARGRRRRASSTSRRLDGAVGHRGDAGARTPLGVVEHLGDRRRAARPRRCARPAPRAACTPMRFAASWARRSARRCVGLAHLRDQLLDAASSSDARRDHDALLGERRASRPASSPAILPPTSAWCARRGGEADQLAAVERRRDDRDVGQVRAAARTGRSAPTRRPARGPRPSTAATAAGIAPRWTGMCSACITISPRGVEQRGRAVAALLDVRRVRAAHQHRAHLLARGAQRAGDDLQRRRGPSRSASALAAPCPSRPSPAQPAGTRASPRAARTSAGPRRRRAGSPRARRTSPRPGVDAASTGAASTQLDRPACRRRGSRSAPRAARAKASRSALGAGSRTAHGQLVRLAAVAQVARDLARRAAAAAARAIASLERGVGQLVAAQQHRALRRRARRSAAARPSALSTPLARRDEDARRSRARRRARAACSGPAPPNASSAKLARVEPALDGHHAQRAHHLGVGDAHDARARSPRRSRPSSPREPRRRLRAAASRRARRRPPAAPASRRPSTRLASVTVGSVPPRP